MWIGGNDWILLIPHGIGRMSKLNLAPPGSTSLFHTEIPITVIFNQNNEPEVT